MNITTLPQLQFAAAKKTSTVDLKNPKTKADFTELLKAAKPCAQFLGDFQSPSVVCDADKVLTVSPGSTNQPLGAGASYFLFAPDGSVSKLQHGPVVAPEYRRPPTITPILAAGSIDATLLDQRQKEVTKRQEELA